MTIQEALSEAATASGHTLYKTGDADAPDSIKDNGGEVVLSLCRVCGRAEIELTVPCVVPVPRAAGELSRKENK